MKIRQPGPQRMKSHARRFATGTRSSVFADGYAGHACRLPGTLYHGGIERNGQSLFSFCRRDFTSTGQDIARFAVLQLDRLRLDLFGQNEKIFRRLRFYQESFQASQEQHLVYSLEAWSVGQ